MPACLEWAEERVEECNDWRDEGANECADWSEDCCDWWPCSWACEVVTWVCIGWVWVSNWVCIGWTVITTAVCVVWDVVTTIINVVFVTLESIFGWVLSAIAFIIELIEAIPILGALVRWVLNIVTWLVWTIVSIVDFIGGLIGIRPEKKLRVCTIILRDETGAPTATPEYAVALLQVAANIYKRDANVRIVPLGPFQYDTGFAGAETVTADWVQTDDSASGADLLDAPCNGGGEWWTGGTQFQWKASTRCFFGSWRRILGYGAPVTCFIVRNIPGASGCALWITDYATVDGGAVPPSNPRVIGHELGHACNLWHLCVDDDPANLMSNQRACDPDSTTLRDLANPRMDNGQVLLVRASKHVTYF